MNNENLKKNIYNILFKSCHISQVLTKIKIDIYWSYELLH